MSSKKRQTRVVNFEQVICNFAGQPLKIEGAAEGSELVTLKYAAVTSLLGENDRGTPGTEKYIRYQLAKKIYEDGVVELELSTIQKIKTVIGQMFVPVISGAAWEMLDKEPEVLAISPDEIVHVQDDQVEEHA